MELFGVLIGIGVFVGIILIMRLIGAWMLRINEIIEEQQKTNAHLKKLNDNLTRNFDKY